MVRAPTSGEADRDWPASPSKLRFLLHAGLLPRAGFETAMRELGVRHDWRRWGRLVLLVVGGCLVLAGIASFVADSWLEIDKTIKLGGLQLLVLVGAAGAWRPGLARLEGRALLFAACVLAGVFLAAFGQVYRTGADAWELFRAWAWLIVLWVVAARAPVHWLLLLVVSDLWVALYLQQVRFYRWETELGAWLILAATQFLALAAFEVARRRGYFRHAATWPRWVLVPVVLYHLCAPLTIVVFDKRWGRWDAWLVIAGLAGCVVGGYRFYRHLGRDLFALTCVGCSCVWTVLVVVLELLGVFQRGGFAKLLIAGLLIVGMLVLLVRWVRGLGVAMQQEVEATGGAAGGTGG